jgi:hypothetical protein
MKLTGRFLSNNPGWTNKIFDRNYGIATFGFFLELQPVFKCSIKHWEKQQECLQYPFAGGEDTRPAAAVFSPTPFVSLSGIGSLLSRAFFLPPPPAFLCAHPIAWKRRGGMIKQCTCCTPLKYDMNSKWKSIKAPHFGNLPIW